MMTSIKKSRVLLSALLIWAPLFSKKPTRNAQQSRFSYYSHEHESAFDALADEYMKNHKAPKVISLTPEEQEKLTTEIPEIPFSTKCENTYALWHHPAIQCPQNTVLNKNGWQNLEFLAGSHDQAPDIARLLDNTETIFGKLYSTYLLTSPTTNISVLHNRQALIKEFVNNTALATRLTESLQRTAAAHNTFSFLYEEESEFNFEAIKKYFFTTETPIFKYLKHVNTSPLAMELLCFKGRLFSYALPSAIPYLFFKGTQALHYNMNFESTRTKFKASDDFKKMNQSFGEAFRTNKVKRDQFVKALNDFYTPLEEHPLAAQLFPNIRAIVRDNNGIQQLLWSNNDTVAKACVEGLMNPAEQVHVLQTLQATFGVLPENCNVGIQSWNATLNELTSTSRKDAAYSMLQNVTPWQKELKNVSDVEQIKIKRLNLEATNPEEFVTEKMFDVEQDDIRWLFGQSAFYTKYTAGDKVKLFKLAQKKCAEQSLTSNPNMSPDTLNSIAKAIAIFGTTVGAIEGLSAYWCYSRENEYNTLTNYLHMQMIAVGTVVRTMEEVSAEIKNNPTLLAGLDHSHHIIDLFDKNSTTIPAKLKQLTNLLLTNTFTGKPSYFSLKGRVLAAYALMKEIKHELAPSLLALGEVDAYLSCAKLMQKHNGKDNNFNFATYLEQDTPYINLEGMWHPFVTSEKAVANSIELGGTKVKNIILTGPNAGGKSTFSKGLTTSLVLAQTIGIVPAKSLVFTPFAKINTYMNITDDTAAGNSLFKSEVLRAQDLLQTINNLDKNKFSFSVMDEMFSGTSPKEGEAASYAVAKNIGANSNSIAIIATHFPKLKELEATFGTFKNYQVRVTRYDNGTFNYPFKLEEGAADQNVALDILQQQGFESSILLDAQEILQNN